MKYAHHLLLVSVSSFVFLLLTGCGGGGSNSSSTQNNTPPPSLQFSASATSITQGASTTLSWSAKNAQTVSIDNGIGTEPVSGSVAVSPSTTTTYTATATGNGQSSVQKVTITVNGKAITSIAVSPGTFYLRVPNTQQLKATATYSDGSTADVTSQVTWNSANSSTASVSTSGLVTAAAPGSVNVSATDGSVSAQAHVAVNAAATASVLTYHNDNARDGAITTESTLTTANVNQAQFGKRYSFPVDGQIYAQPLYVSNLSISGGTHNVVFVATENDSVYAFDADGRQTAPLWKVSVGTPETANEDLGIKPSLGITSTPVIDASTNTIYVVAVNTAGTHHFQLHALDLSTGAEKFGGPVQVTAQTSGTGVGSSGGAITLEDSCYQRNALVEANGNIYIAFGHCPHGWLLAYDANSLTQTAAFNSTPDTSGGAFWSSGGTAAVDAGGNLYWITGTDEGDAQPGYNDAFLKMTPTLTVADYFIPNDNSALIASDADLGSGAAVLMPDNGSSTPHEVIGGGKDGRLFVVNRDNMGEFQTPDAVIQAVKEGTSQYDNLFCTPAYWNGTIYVHSASDVVRAFGWSSTTGLLTTSPTSSGTPVLGAHGATPSISANGSSEGILWEVESTNYSSGGAAVLHAYDATHLGTELYNSTQAGSRDSAGPAIKFTPPTIADGLVFVPTSSELDVYGLL